MKMSSATGPRAGLLLSSFPSTRRWRGSTLSWYVLYGIYGSENIF